MSMLLYSSIKFLQDKNSKKCYLFELTLQQKNRSTWINNKRRMGTISRKYIEPLFHYGVLYGTRLYSPNNQAYIISFQYNMYNVSHHFLRLFRNNGQVP